ncbi:DinB family protein [Planktotalea sp.]|uniref:DinB family protein n=1 Tax=Planktotalea sp. TaxID=2029877 RepID=UPI003296FD09
MITPEYCQLMARYNRWQNEELRKSLETLSEADLTAERGAFFGSIFKTVNHLLWGDTLWISRFDGGDCPVGTDLTKTDTTVMCKDLAEWSLARFQTDARFVNWAKSVSHIDLSGDLTWFSGSIQRDVSKPKGACIAHMFNHQTHHRGQVHAMLGAAGAPMYTTDLPFLPE